MARKQKNAASYKQDRRETILAFAHRLHLPSIEAYQQWCEQQGFSTRLNKTQRELECEYQQYTRNVAMRMLKRHKRESNLQFYIKKLYSQEIRYAGLQSDVLHTIGNGFRKTQNRRLLCDVLCQLEEKSKLLSHVDYVKGIISFVFHYSKWIRPFADWQPHSRNAERQFASLARHLFAKYPVPAFMDKVWQHGSGKAKGWFIHIGMGHNIRTAPHLPITLTKKMANHFLQASGHYSVNAAFRWAQIHALGGNKAAADAVAETRMARQFNDEDFWLSVLRFFVDNPLLDTRHYGPIIDYIWHQKYEPQIVFIDRGVAREDPPLQPNFSMRGRTPDTLLRQVDAWHRRLGKESRGGHAQWMKSKYADFRYVEGKAQSRNMKVWTIRELLNSKELIAEGRTLQHCVATYAHSCLAGHTSIWTMDLQTSYELEKRLTIELHLRTKTIRQVRGLRNRLAAKPEMQVIRLWASKEGFRIAAYVAAG
ncbi:MAG: PcfJ domain-containing protein [Gammaproteobacteria bacterium]|jgi:hypothetical protein